MQAMLTKRQLRSLSPTIHPWAKGVTVPVDAVAASAGAAVAVALYPSGVGARGPGSWQEVRPAHAANPAVGRGGDRGRRCGCREGPSWLPRVEQPGVGVWAGKPGPPRPSPAARGVVDPNAVVPKDQADVVGQVKVVVGTSDLAQDEGVVYDMVGQLPILPGHVDIPAPVALVKGDLGLAHLHAVEELPWLAQGCRRRGQRYFGPRDWRLRGAFPHPPPRGGGPARTTGRGPPARKVVVKVDAVLEELVGDELGKGVVAFLDGVVPRTQPAHDAVG